MRRQNIFDHTVGPIVDSNILYETSWTDLDLDIKKCFVEVKSALKL